MKVTIEHGHANHLADDWSSTAYWYQTLPSKPFGILPVEERIQLMPQLVNIAKLQGVSLNAEMQQSQEMAEERMKEYDQGRKAELQKKLDRTPWHSEGNVKQARQVRQTMEE